MDQRGENRTTSRRRFGRETRIALVGVALIAGGAIALVLGVGDGAWAVVFVGIVLILAAYGLLF